MRLIEMKRSELLAFAVDLLMLALILVNLGWILFDGFYSSHMIQEFFATYAEPFHQWYMPIHRNFSFYDSWFVLAFVTELLIRWFIAAWRGTYHKWWFYPFVHWYDTLGCIPVGSFRFLRILRLVSIAYRLQRNKIIDISRTYVYRQAVKYYRILVEEVSDRVVLNVLGGMRDEVSKGSPLTGRILNEVVQPRKADLVEWLSDRLQTVLSDHYGHYRPDLKDYVDERIEQAVSANKEISTLQAIPVVGSTIRHTLERAIADIVFRVVDDIVQDLSSSNNKVVIDELSGVLFDAILFEEDDERLERTVRSMLTESIDMVADEVNIQQWKLHEIRQEEVRARAKRIAAIRKERLRNPLGKTGSSNAQQEGT